MFHKICPITNISRIKGSIYTLEFKSQEIAKTTKPGQFINIKVNDTHLPLLRRPFSVYFIQQDKVQIIFNTRGEGTKILSEKTNLDQIDVIGPLGRPFTVKGDFKKALLVAGGMGVASLPLLTKYFIDNNVPIETFLGTQTAKQLITNYLINIHLSTDDGSKGFHGTVVDMLKGYLEQNKEKDLMIYACGPMPMLHSLSKLSDQFQIPCEISVETMMACGIGLCQGCVIESNGAENKYFLVCKEGPVFNSKTVRL